MNNEEVLPTSLTPLSSLVADRIFVQELKAHNVKTKKNALDNDPKHNVGMVAEQSAVLTFSNPDLEDLLGNVSGPPSSRKHSVIRFTGTDTKHIQDSVVILDSESNLSSLADTSSNNATASENTISGDLQQINRAITFGAGTKLTAAIPSLSAPIVTLPSVGASNALVLAAGTQEIGGSKSFTQGLNINAPANQVKLGPPSAISTLNYSTPAMITTHTIPADSNQDATVLPTNQDFVPGQFNPTNGFVGSTLPSHTYAGVVGAAFGPSSFNMTGGRKARVSSPNQNATTNPFTLRFLTAEVHNRAGGQDGYLAYNSLSLTDTASDLLLDISIMNCAETTGPATQPNLGNNFFHFLIVG
jgi:hypothetical protein